MKKTALLAPALVAAMALSAAAQQGIQTNADRKETLKVTVSGGVDMDWVYRGKEIVEVLGGPARDEARIESDANLRFDIDLSNKVSVLLNLKATRLNGDYTNIGQLGNGGQNVELWTSPSAWRRWIRPSRSARHEQRFHVRHPRPGQPGLLRRAWRIVQRQPRRHEPGV
jgi:hypothetical protein